MANNQISIKDMAIISAFMEPFKWISGQSDSVKLGESAEIVSKCFN